MSNYNFGKTDKDLLEKNFVKALKDKDFVELVNTLDVSDEVKYRYTSTLEDLVKINNTCSKCSGIENCPYSIPGLKEEAIVEDGIIKFIYKKCPYKEENDAQIEYLKNIDIYKMPKEIAEASFKNIYKDDSRRLEVIKYLKKFYDEFRKKEYIKGLYLSGNFGCGKTYLVSALFNELAKKNIKSTIVYFPELLRSLKASFGNVEDNYDDKFDLVKESPLLLLDDIGAEKLSDWARDEVLGVILQYRMEEHLPTFFTSNLSLKELEEHLQIGNNSADKIKARRIIERIKFLCEELEMNSVNRRV